MKHLRDGDVKAVLDDFYDPDDEWATRCKAAIAALPDAREWQKIETAPKDGTEVDLWSASGRNTDCYWNDEDAAWVRSDGGWVRAPTHWQPLPDAPKEQT